MGSTEARVLLTELLVLKPVYIRIGLVLFIFYRRGKVMKCICDKRNEGVQAADYFYR